MGKTGKKEKRDLPIYKTTFMDLQSDLIHEVNKIGVKHQSDNKNFPYRILPAGREKRAFEVQ